MRWMSLVVLATAATLASCGPPQAPPERAPDGPAPEQLATAEPTATAPENQDAPEISRSVGKKGGVVVFWPRVIPRSDDPEIQRLAAEVQQELVALAKQALPDRQLDVRPAPERVCPRSGCEAMTLGALLLHREGGCTVVGLVAEPGASPTRPVPWAGVIALRQKKVAFRDPPENEVTIKDAVPCADLVKSLGANRDELMATIKEAAAAR